MLPQQYGPRLGRGRPRALRRQPARPHDVAEEGTGEHADRRFPPPQPTAPATSPRKLSGRSGGGQRALPLSRRQRRDGAWATAARVRGAPMSSLSALKSSINIKLTLSSCRVHGQAPLARCTDRHLPPNSLKSERRRVTRGWRLKADSLVCLTFSPVGLVVLLARCLGVLSRSARLLRGTVEQAPAGGVRRATA